MRTDCGDDIVAPSRRNSLGVELADRTNHLSAGNGVVNGLARPLPQRHEITERSQQHNDLVTNLHTGPGRGTDKGTPPHQSAMVFALISGHDAQVANMMNW